MKSIQMSDLVRIVRDIIAHKQDRVDHLLMYPDDFVELLRNNDLGDTTDVIGFQFELDDFSYDYLVNRSLCILGVPIRTSEYVKPGHVFKVILVKDV